MNFKIIKIVTHNIMKKLLNLLFTTSLLVSLVIFASCGGGGGDDDGPAPDTAAQQRADLLKNGGTWTVDTANGGVKLNDTDAGGTDFTITFTVNQNRDGGTYTTGGESRKSWIPNLWLPNGSWEFDGNEGTMITRDSGTDNEVEITVATITATTAKLTFTTQSTTSGSRIAGINGGNWEFNLRPAN